MSPIDVRHRIAGPLAEALVPDRASALRDWEDLCAALQRGVPARLMAPAPAALDQDYTLTAADEPVEATAVGLQQATRGDFRGQWLVVVATDLPVGISGHYRIPRAHLDAVGYDGAVDLIPAPTPSA